MARYVGDGDSLCIANASDPAARIEVRLSDFDAPELHSPTGRADHDRLPRIVAGRRLTCVAERGRKGRVIVYDRVIAACRHDGRCLGDLFARRESTRTETGWKAPIHV